MPVAEVSGVRIRGIASAVPEPVVTVDDDQRLFGPEIAKVSETTGVRQRRKAPPGSCTSDLCYFAAQRLLDELQWEPSSIQLLILITQTPDYVLPATACILQERLKLSNDCAAFDINLGCSAFPYGLWTASQLLTSLRGARRALLLVGDTPTHFVAPADRATAPLFGDAGAATALELDSSAEPTSYVIGTDGGGAPHLMIHAGSFRAPLDDANRQRTLQADGNCRSDADLHMNGAEVFAFTLREVPKLVKNTLAAANCSFDDVHGVVFHQANAFLLKHLAGRLKVPAEKLVLSLENFGNTSSASIPLAITDHWGGSQTGRDLRLLVAGFGVGWSWSGAVVDLQQTVLPELVIVPASALPNTDRGSAPSAAA